LRIVLIPRKAFHARTIYSDTFENVTNSSIHRESFISEKIKIIPVVLPAPFMMLEFYKTPEGRLSPLPIITDTTLPTNDPITTVSIYVEFRTTETSSTSIWYSSTSDFPLKNAPLALVANSREYRKTYNDSLQTLVRLFGPGESTVSSPGLLDDSEYCWNSKARWGLPMGFNKDSLRLIPSRIMAFRRKREAVRLFEVRPEYPYPFDYHEA
jgi:hypothetical protein